MIDAKKRCISLPLIAFCVLLIFSGCDSPGGFDDPQEGYGVITVSIDDEFARTIYPLVEFARYDYFFAKVIKGKTQNFEKQVPVEGVFTLELGDWQVRVDVYATEDDPYPAATGTSVIFNVSREGIKQVKIQLTGNEKSGYGSFSYYITYPEGTTIDTFELKSYPTPGTTIDLIPASNSGIRTNIPAGCYSITIFLSNGESKAGASDAVYILEKLESAYGTAAKPIVFTERNFIKPTGTPVASDFDFGNLAQVAGTGVQPVTVTPREGKSTGAITILYDGSQTLPTAVGTYAVTFNVAASPNWYAAYNLSAGTLVLVATSNVIDINSDSNWNGLATDNRIIAGADAANPNNYLINVNKNVSATGKTTNTFGYKEYINVFINGNDKTISLSGNGHLLRIGDNQSVTMNNLTLKGQGPTVSNSFALVQITYDSSIFTMNSGTITGNTSNGAGNGGVYVEGIFNMAGGTISNNTTTNGGGVYVVDTFNMNGGTISDNTATQDGGGGVFVETGTFNMNGGTISDNTATSAYGCGGGVFVETGSTFNMNGGTISHNTAEVGGGVYTSSTFEMNGGVISRNTAVSSGGGVYSSGTFTMDNGTISGNKVTGSGSCGGGVLVSNGTFNMNGGTISGNTCNIYGGGVFVVDCIFNMSGGTIYGSNSNPSTLRNTAAYGAALFIDLGSGTAQYGSGSSWTPFDIYEYNDTIRVANGVLQP